MSCAKTGAARSSAPTAAPVRVIVVFMVIPSLVRLLVDCALTLRGQPPAILGGKVVRRAGFGRDRHHLVRSKKVVGARARGEQGAVGEAGIHIGVVAEIFG